MPANLAILDFDRTLFDPAFYRAFVDVAVGSGLLTPETAGHIRTTLDDPAQTIDLLEALRAHHVDADAAVNLARTQLAPNQFLYPDVPQFLARLEAANISVVIMTTATGRYWQEIKLSMCPVLGKFRQMMLSGNKGEHIKAGLTRANHQLALPDLPGEHFNGIMLVDDRVEALAPLAGESGFTLWHIERPGSKYRRSRDHAGIRHVSSLNEVTIP